MKILIVDDEIKIANVLSERFRLRGIDAIPVYDGTSALETLKKDSFDGMILDLRLPDINGMEILRRTKQCFPGIKVVMLSGHASDRDFENCLEMGAIRCFHKPADIKSIAEAFSKNGHTSNEDH